MPDERVFLADYIGLTPYESAMRLQSKLMQARIERKMPDMLLLLEHAPVITTGRFYGQNDIRATLEELHREGISVFHTNRGGSVTYHGPGQLVGYPIISLTENHLGVREYIGYLEEVIIKTLHHYSVRGEQIEGYPGVWFEGRKICSIGIHISHGITTHGFALNVNNNLQHFSYINPCGNSQVTMTSLSEVLRQDIGIEAVANAVIEFFAEVFKISPSRGLKCQAICDALSG